MPDREKVINGITHHKLGMCDMNGKICPYWTEDDDCSKKMLADAIALLKEQEAVVRCISCTFYRSNGECALHNGRWKPEGFCSWAIRNEGR